MMDSHFLLTLVVVACGSGMFVRLVAKEKHRREKHLTLRLHEKIKGLEARKRRRRREAMILGYRRVTRADPHEGPGTDSGQDEDDTSGE